MDRVEDEEMESDAEVDSYSSVDSKLRVQQRYLCLSANTWMSSKLT